MPRTHVFSVKFRFEEGTKRGGEGRSTFLIKPGVLTTPGFYFLREKGVRKRIPGLGTWGYYNALLRFVNIGIGVGDYGDFNGDFPNWGIIYHRIFIGYADCKICIQIPIDLWGV
jgi:hypothetical protein